MSTVELWAMAFFVLVPTVLYILKKVTWDQIWVYPKGLAWIRSMTIFTLWAVWAIFFIHTNIFPFPERIIDKNPIRQIIFISALPQELFFRWTMLPLLKEKIGEKKALLVSSSIFSLMHIFVPGVHWRGAVVMLLLTFIGWWYRWRHMLKYKNLYFVIASHAAILIAFNFLV